MLLRTGVRIGISFAIFFLGERAQAAEPQTQSDPAPLHLHRPDGYSETLIPATTASWAIRSLPTSVPRRAAVGINDLGVQARLHLNPTWASEARFLMGSSSSNAGEVHALVFGVRGYRFYQEHRHCRLYLGLEGDYVKTSLRTVNTANPTPITNTSGFGETSGYAAGGFGGIEFRIGRRIALDLDAGPYMIGLQEKVTRVSDASLDFVVDTAINVYLF